MSLTATDQRFARHTGTLWRDTGHHVLALPETDGAEVAVLGGGSAVLWRLLDQPLALHELLEHLVSDEGEADPAAPEVLTCLQDLVRRGLVQEWTEPSR